MLSIRTARLLATVAALIAVPTIALAQTAPAAPPMKTIGQPSATKPELIQSLIVRNVSMTLKHLVS